MHYYSIYYSNTPLLFLEKYENIFHLTKQSFHDIMYSIVVDLGEIDVYDHGQHSI